MKQIYPPLIIQASSKNVPSQTFFFLKRVILCFVILQIHMLTLDSEVFGQEIELTGKVVNMNQEPVSNVHISLQSMPEIFCYSDSIGNFSLVKKNTLSTEDLIANNQSVYLLENGSLFINIRNSSLNISFFDMMGRNIGTIVKEKNLNGKYIIYPSAYIQGSAKGIYIARVKLGNYQKAIKFCNVTELFSPLGLHYIGSSSLTSGKKTSSKFNFNTKADNTIVFDHDFYKSTQVLTSNLISDVGIVELENFGDYSTPANMTPDKADLYSDSGTVLNLFGKDSTEFTIHFSPYSVFNNKLTIKAIPIDELEGLAPGVELISAVHLEPGGTKFNFPALVYLDLKDTPITDDLVVFLYDEITDKTYYIPYHNVNPFDNNSIAFSLSHFSDIGIGYQSDPEDLDEPLTSDDFVTEINNLISNGEEVPDDLFTVWFEQVVLRAIDAVYTVETLQNAISEMNLLGTYIIYVGKDIADFGFYNKLTSNLSTKIKFIFKIINNECENVSDPCTKRDLAKIALTMVMLTQQIKGLDPLNVTDICNADALVLVDDFVMEKAMLNIDVSEKTQILIDAKNILKVEISSDEMDIEWYSEDPNIASVNQEGVVTGIKMGTVKVFAKYCDIIRYVRVNVDEDIRWCDTHSGIYSGMVNAYHSTKNEYGVGCESNMTIKILANFNDETYTGDHTYTGSWYSSIKCTEREWNGARYVYTTSYENQSGQLHPSHRLGALTCVYSYSGNFISYHVIDARRVSLYRELNIVKYDMNETHGVGVLTLVE